MGEPDAASEAAALGSCSLCTTVRFVVIGFLFALSGLPLPSPTTIIADRRGVVKGFRADLPNI